MSENKGDMVLKNGELSYKSGEYISAIHALKYLRDDEIYGIVECITNLDLLLMEKVRERERDLKKEDIQNTYKKIRGYKSLFLQFNKR